MAIWTWSKLIKAKDMLPLKHFVCFLTDQFNPLTPVDAVCLQHKN